MSRPIIEIQDIGKKYKVGAQREPYLSLRDQLSQRFHRNGQGGGKEKTDFWALKEVSFEVFPGDTVGIIGRNGAGKSTLLKILSQITPPTEGKIIMRGRAASLLEVGTGFHAELTGRENIFLNGAILGLTRAQVKAKFDEIVAFAEVDRFLDTPVKRYSSGMYVRLAFAVAAHLEPEILIIDEVLAVGDAAFQKKCLGKMSDVARGGRTVLFVSHNMAAIKQLCPQCFWLDRARLRESGPCLMVVDSYLNDYNGAAQTGEVHFPEDIQKEFQLTSAKLQNREGIGSQNFACDEAIMLEFTCQVRQRVPGLYGYLGVGRPDGTEVMVSDSYDVAPNPLDSLPVGKHSVRIVIPPRLLAPGDYTICLSFTSRENARGFEVDCPGNILSFHVDDHTSRRGNGRGGFFSILLPWVLEES